MFLFAPDEIIKEYSHLIYIEEDKMLNKVKDLMKIKNSFNGTSIK